jgi:hypothetical protein
LLHKILPEDVVIIDPISNITFCSTDHNSNPADPKKIDGRWHIEGELNVRSKTYIKTCLASLKFILDEIAENKCLMPVPRYLTDKCCKTEGHITNYSEINFDVELQLDLDG